MDESNVGYSDTNYVQKLPKKEVTTKYIPVYKEDKCGLCEKPTHSHKFPDKTFLCHGCYERMSEEELAAYRAQHEVKR